MSFRSGPRLQKNDDPTFINSSSTTTLKLELDGLNKNTKYVCPNTNTYNGKGTLLLKETIDTINIGELGDVDITNIADNDILKYNVITDKFENVVDAGGGGEINTSSNVNVGGVGVFKQKTGVDFEFKGINAGSSKITITDDVGNNEIDIDVDVTQLGIEANSTGINSGGVLSVGTPPDKFSISDGSAQFVDQTGTKTVLNFSGLTDIVVTNILTSNISFVGINSAGTVIQQTSPFTNTDRRTIAVFGVVVHVDRVNVDVVNIETEVAYNTGSQLFDLYQAIGFFNVSGNLYTPNVAGNLTFDKSIGDICKLGSNYTNGTDDPNIKSLPSLNTISFQYRFSDGSNGTTGVTIDPANIEDGAGGLIPLSTNKKWSIQRIYSFVSNNVKIQRGIEEFGSKDKAIAGISTEAYITEPSIAANGLLRAFLVIKQDCGDLTDTGKAIFIEAPKFQSGGTASATSATDLQGAYDNSLVTEILTDATRGALTFQRGSALDTDNVLEIQNGSGTNTFEVDGNGLIKIKDTTTTNTISINATAGGNSQILSIPILSVDDEILVRQQPQVIINKTFTSNTNDIIARSLWNTTGSNSVSTFASAQPSIGQVLTADSTTTATWQTIPTQSADPLQSGYNASFQAQITTDNTNLALQVKNGSASNNDNVFEILDQSSTVMLAMDGTGKLQLTDIAKTGTLTIVADTLTSSQTITVPNVGVGEEFITKNNIQIMTNKEMTDSTNNINATNIWIDGKGATVNLLSAVAPSVGDILQATSTTALEFVSSVSIAPKIFSYQSVIRGALTPSTTTYFPHVDTLAPSQISFTRMVTDCDLTTLSVTILGTGGVKAITAGTLTVLAGIRNTGGTVGSSVVITGAIMSSGAYSDGNMLLTGLTESFSAGDMVALWIVSSGTFASTFDATSDIMVQATFTET
jgi:hypothetical protein